MEFFFHILWSSLAFMQLHADYCSGYTTLRRRTLHLLSHFVEKAFCRSVILSKVHFVETGFRRILSTKYSMLTWPPYCTCWFYDYVSCNREATDTRDYWFEVDCRFYKGAREWDERVKQSFIENSVCVYSNSRNDVPWVAQRYETIAAHTRRRLSVLVVFVVFCVHVHSFAGLIRRTPPPTLSDTVITQRHSDTTVFQLRAHWVRIS